MAVYDVVPANATVSSGFVLEKSDRYFTIATNSMAGASVGIQFAMTSTPVSADYATFMRGDGTAAIFTATSGSAPQISAPIPPVTPWARLLVGATVAAVRSFAILPVQTS